MAPAPLALRAPPQITLNLATFSHEQRSKVLLEFLVAALQRECIALKHELGGHGFGRPILGLLNELNFKRQHARDLVCAYLTLIASGDQAHAQRLYEGGSLDGGTPPELKRL